ncbi:hypothetical protein [Shinella sp.]|uniref:hypothetical protein n=1 Tax=Shinella sp. TaxID=1870904 RepID=UPI0040363D92
MSATITAKNFKDATLLEFTNNMYDLGTDVTYMWGGAEVTQTFKGQLFGSKKYF